MPKKSLHVLVAGGQGQLGRSIAAARHAGGLQTVCLPRSGLDIASPASIDRAIDHYRPDAVINAAAWTAVDLAESRPDEAFAVNTGGPAALAASCARRSIPLVHISTDYVFDGTKKGAYTEADPVSPVSAYGRSKAEGEEAVQRLCAHHVIVRTAWLYSVFGNNFVKTMLRLGAEKDVLRVVGDQTGCPTHAAGLAEALLSITAAILWDGQDNWGLYHYCGQGRTSWHGFALKIFELAQGRFPLKVRQVEAIPGSAYPSAARRPANSVLDCEKIGRVFGLAPPNWEDGLERMLAGLYRSGGGDTGGEFSQPM